MTNEDVSKMVESGERSAFLLGQVTGGLLSMQEHFYTTSPRELKDKIDAMLELLNSRITDIYYKKSRKK